MVYTKTVTATQVIVWRIVEKKLSYKALDLIYDIQMNLLHTHQALAKPIDKIADEENIYELIRTIWKAKELIEHD
jgi:hypothetical protein